MTSRGRDHWLAPWCFLTPFAVLFVVFAVVPLVQSLPLSLSHTFGPSASLPVGLEKYESVIADPLFWTALWNTCLFAAGSVFVQLPLALGLAMLLNRPHLIGRGVFRLLFFSPQLVGLIFVGVLASVLFQKQHGLINIVLAAIIGPVHSLLAATAVGSWIPSPGEVLATPWLETLALPTLILTALWMYVGFNMIYFLAALQNVSADLHDAAMLDGAGPASRFWNVTLPAIKPVAMFVVLLSIIGSFQLFELPYVMLPDGVGVKDRGLTIVTYLFKNGFEAGDLGYAAAIGWMLALLLACFGVLQRIASRSEAV